jgi:ubiquinone/menaquinone biosynthesis C-methylase UbiE
MDEQTSHFENESKRYVSSYIDLPVYALFPKTIDLKEINTMCDVGCGNGELLSAYKNLYSISKCVGVEPSEESVKLLKNKFDQNIGFNFLCAFAHKLPFDTNNFDLVLCNSVLHWVGRDEYLQSLGELIRVTKKYLIIMDFVGSKDYRVPYHHKLGLFTYKQDFEKVITASGIMEKIETIQYYYDSSNSTFHNINENDLHPFEGNILNYHSRKMIVFQKNYDLLPLKSIQDFS